MKNMVRKMVTMSIAAASIAVTPVQAQEVSDSEIGQSECDTMQEELEKQHECAETRWEVGVKEMDEFLEELDRQQWHTCNKTKYVSADTLYVRKKKHKDAQVMASLTYNTKVKVIKYCKASSWVKVDLGWGQGFVKKKYLSKTEMNYRYGDVPGNNSFKSFMPYTAITTVSSKQYQLQHSVAYTGSYGIRMIGGRYCVAIGSYYHNPIGGIFDIVMQNGTIIPCISADQKADQHTDWTNRQTIHDGSIVEFLIDNYALVSSIRRSGTVGSANPGWEGEIAYFKIYDKVN